MIKKYKNIVAAGCSFIEGSNIYEAIITPGKNREVVWTGRDHRMSKLLAKKLVIPEVNLALAGSSNYRIINNIINYVLENPDSKDLVIIGLSGITRRTVYSNFTEREWDIHTFQLNNEDQIKKLMNRFFGSDDDMEGYIKYRELEAKYLFNFEYEANKLSNNVLALCTLLEKYNKNYIVFNSLDDSIKKIKDKINFMSFNIDSDLKIEYPDAHKQVKPRLEDCWYHHVRVNHYKEYGEFGNTQNRQSTRPWGKWFCGGHPSPQANEDLTKLIIKKHNKLYPDYKI